MDNILSINNFDKCMFIFSKYMQDTYDVDVKSIKDIDLKKTLYSLLLTVRDNAKNAGLSPAIENLNKDVIKQLVNYYKENFKVVEQKKPTMKTLDRDQQVYGDRPLSTLEFKAPLNINKAAEVNQRYEQFVKTP